MNPRPIAAFEEDCSASSDPNSDCVRAFRADAGREVTIDQDDAESCWQPSIAQANAMIRVMVMALGSDLDRQALDAAVRATGPSTIRPNVAVKVETLIRLLKEFKSELPARAIVAGQSCYAAVVGIAHDNKGVPVLHIIPNPEDKP